MPRFREGRNRFPRADGALMLVWSPEMYRALIDVVDDAKPTVRTTLPGLAVKIEKALIQLPKDRTNAIAKDRIIAKLYKIPLVDKHTWHTFLERGKEVVDYSKLPDEVLSKDEYANWLEGRSKKVQERKRQLAEARSLASYISMDQMSGATGDLQSVLENNAHILAHSDGPPLRTMSARATQLQVAISQAVTDRLLGARRRASEIIVDFQLPGTCMWTDLWEVLMGGLLGPFEPGLSNLQAFQQTVPLTLEVFVKAVIGAAITKWALEPPPLPEPDEDSGAVLRALMELNRRAHPVGGAGLIDDAVRLALKRSATPKIAGKASAMAADLDNLLLRFIIPQPFGATISHVRSSSQPALDDGTVGDMKQAQTPRWVLSWKNELQRIFETALTLRVDLEAARGECSLDYPKPGELRLTREQENLPVQFQGMVLIGTFPRVSARFPDGPGGSLGPSISIAEAQFCCFQETGKEDRLLGKFAMLTSICGARGIR